ncbi:HypC/HybG/HupF family hydrogenase formation chaperone [Cellulomonas sp. WB94]|uniref:HypC/HybG/HupF family hydrogenase formation chaperone n=1 Tax=Cellulomonas sp. WB94 TaxID=2173174 RepID=UPI000D58748B|nr:HypC/HybG/HupF family hydrogenase formation chaperone [Cellulomonas sp. WB94]PVU82181.1 HypC/HybG/HupF family hydrogenase formation chaperone [Cellulomonas sp. WB94]
MCLGEVVQVVEVTPDGVVLASAETRTLQISLLALDGPVAPGDWVLAHSGFALARLSAAEALEARTLRGSVPAQPDPRSSDPRPSSPVPMEAAP